jgi:hypothetical protein
MDVPRECESRWTLAPRVFVQPQAVRDSRFPSCPITKGIAMENPNTNSLRIERWMAAIVFGTNAPSGGIRFTLHHAGLDEAQRLLRTWDIEAIPEREEFRELVAKIDEEAADDTAHLGWGVQRYVLSATTLEGRPLGSLSLRYSGNNTSMEAGSYLDTEPASSRGQIALSMRHTDGAYRLLGAGFGTILDALNRRLGQQDLMIEKMMLNQTKNFELMAELADKKFEREVLADRKKKEAELEFYREVDQIDRTNRNMRILLEQILPLLPVVTNRIFRKKGESIPTTSREDMLTTLFESMSSEQREALQQMLSPTQLASLMEILSDLFSARDGAGQQGPAPKAQASSRASDSWSPPTSVSKPKPGATFVENPPRGAAAKNSAPGTDMPQKRIFEPGTFRIPNLPGMGQFPDLGAKGTMPPMRRETSRPQVIPHLQSSTMSALEPESAAKLTHEAAGIALEQIKEKLVPWLIARAKAGEPLDPGAILPKQTRIFELFMLSITRKQYDEFMAGGFGFDAEERSVLAKLAEMMKVVPALADTSNPDGGPTGGDSGPLPSAPAGGK